ncbi:MAG: M20/M25/M40 family metallo-hydrolase, partial [Aureliella sp.]
APGTVAVHNGADDNGSGTVTMLEIARQLSHSTSPNRRTLIFMAFSAEESGLLGSQFYVRNPRWPLEDTVAMINLDMVGRLKDDELTVYGTGTAAEFNEQIDRWNEKYRFNVVKIPQGRGASDHANFYNAKIPVYHFFTGLHNDYHRPSDDVDKINVAGMVRISRMVTDIVREIAESPARPQFVEIKGSASPRRQNASSATLGVRLARSLETEAKIVSVIDGGPAQKAGLQAGDVIVEFNGAAIPNIVALRDALIKARGGESAKIGFRRENVMHAATVKLGE